MRIARELEQVTRTFVGAFSRTRKSLSLYHDHTDAFIPYTLNDVPPDLLKHR